MKDFEDESLWFLGGLIGPRILQDPGESRVMSASPLRQLDVVLDHTASLCSDDTRGSKNRAPQLTVTFQASRLTPKNYFYF